MNNKVIMELRTKVFLVDGAREKILELAKENGLVVCADGENILIKQENETN